MIAGESRLPTKKQLLESAHHFSLKQFKNILEEAQQTLSKCMEFSKDSSVGKESLDLIHKTISRLSGV